ncbi:MAG: hypothetical protein KGM47_11700 [Acidobacteriota bacterium]|nr:hypothetical protein [Acidobacteriota bacterium]
MRVGINLARPESRIERSVYLWAPILTLAAVIVLVRLVFFAGHQFTVYRAAQHSTLRYQAETQEMQAKQARLAASLRQPGTLKLYNQITFLNQLIDQKRVSLSSLTLKVAHLLPAQSRITALALKATPSGPVIDISIEGNGDAVAGQFLNNLEASPDFDGITVTDQSFDQSGSQKGLVALTCSARYVGKMEKAEP